MQTEKLYYQDSHLRSFQAQVLACEPSKHGYDVILDRTAFYPEGGGQPGDIGTLGGVRVHDTHERDGAVVHYCDAPLTVGKQVNGEIDWQRRFSLMQLHSGEHLVSGIIHRRFGYENVGFHMGADMMTIDLSGMLTAEDLRQIEREANEAVWRDLPTQITWPDAAALQALAYRSKKELTGAVRIVTFPGVDVCACCGTHVAHTGEIGLIKIFTCQKFHDGVRLEMLCGEKAYSYVCGLVEQNRQTSVLLSAKAPQTAESVKKLLDEQAQLKLRCVQLERRVVAARAAGCQGAGDVLLFESGLSPDALRLLVSEAMAASGGRCAVFTPAAQGYQYFIGDERGGLRELSIRMNSALHGRGGGKPNFVQGSVQAAEDEIRAFFAQEEAV